MPISKEYIAFGPYVLVERLAVGGMAEVFLARERGAGERTVVVKRMHAATSADDDARARFLDESKLATLLQHPNIVRVHEVGMHDGAYFMALEWLVGWELREVIDRTREMHAPLPVAIAVKLARDAARGLGAAHAARSPDGTPLSLVHRDVSPRNLFVTADGVVKILDFGIAKSKLRTRQTGAQVVVGTLGYMAPEQVDAGVVDQRSDVFSLGVVLHELLTGEPLFGRGDLQAIVHATIEAPIAAPVRSDGALHGDVVAVVMRALQRDPRLRYQEAFAFEEALQRLLDTLGEPSDHAVGDALTELFRGSAQATPQEAHASAHVAVSRWADELATAVTPGERIPVDLATPAPKPVKRRSRLWFGLSALAVVTVIGAIWKVELASVPAPVAPPPAPAAEKPAEEPPARPTEEPPTGPPKRPRKSAKLRITTAPKPPPPRTEPAPRPEPPPPAAPEPVRQSGRLTLDARPWANVYLGATFLGPTPLVERVVPAGRVTLRLVDPVSGRSQDVVVDIPANGEVRRVVRRD